MKDSPNALELIGPEPLGPDHEYVLKHFFGKSQEEARDFYEGRTHYITEDFMWMAPAGLRYYLPPFLDYLKSETGKHDKEVANILGALSTRVQETPQLPQDVLQTAKEICAYIKQHCKRFDISPNDQDFKIVESAKLTAKD